MSKQTNKLFFYFGKNDAMKNGENYFMHILKTSLKISKSVLHTSLPYL